MAVGLKLGGETCRPHRCRWENCGAEVTRTGAHGLHCRFSQGRHPRHTMINEEIKKALCALQIPAVREPPDLSRVDGKRPDGVTTIPWSRGRYLLWDATVVDTLAPSYINRTSETVGAAATQAESKPFAGHRNPWTSRRKRLAFPQRNLKKTQRLHRRSKGGGVFPAEISALCRKG